MGHIRMMGAAQPFISGAISKTVNLPKDASVEDIMNVYTEGWKLGLKALAIYRDGSKRTQPLSTSNDDTKQKSREPQQPVTLRRRLPDERRSVTHKFSVAGHEGYVTVGLYDDGTPGEVFITMAKEGSTISGLMDTFATSISIGLQYGVPLKTMVNKFSHMRFEPSGFTGNPDIPIAKSVVDYLFRWLGRKFLPQEEQEKAIAESVKPIENGNGNGHSTAEAPKADVRVSEAFMANQQKLAFNNQEDAPACSTCGSIMVRNAACYKCLNCGETSGCS